MFVLSLSNTSIPQCLSQRIPVGSFSPLVSLAFPAPFVDRWEQLLLALIKADWGLSTVSPCVQQGHSVWDYHTCGSGINPSRDMGTRNKRLPRMAALPECMLGVWPHKLTFSFNDQLIVLN